MESVGEMVSERRLGARMVSLGRWLVLLVVVLLGSCAAGDNNDLDTDAPATDNDDYLLKQVVWKRCYRKLTPACLKLGLVRTVEVMSRDSTLFLVPGVYFSSNSSDTDHMPPELARSLSSDLAPLDDLVAFSLRKYLRSLTLNVNLADFVSGGNRTLQETVIDSVTGRKKEGLGGYGAIAAMMGGMMATMMMAGLAALAGKALMTSLAALMMAAFAAMKGGGGGGGESKTYEVITKPIVSHVNTHSSEVQHEHHGHYHKRSLTQPAHQEVVGLESTGEGLHDGKNSQNGESPNQQSLYASLNEEGLDTSKPRFKNPGKSLTLAFSEGNPAKKKDDSVHNFYFDDLKYKDHHHQPKKRSALSSEPGTIGNNHALGSHQVQEHRELKDLSDEQSLWTLGLFR